MRKNRIFALRIRSELPYPECGKCFFACAKIEFLHSGSVRDCLIRSAENAFSHAQK
ncbi:Uncharacterized protein dnm_032850 [Desulfonema magnum]|uniref:Uncharacterized protein n=1 Tax=Desulfonema magnum TaxID=45655 RepID=A0A975GN00_9BACT|nr:Uncharacterized protein dnm_032850 [Desulfonema magnum]